MKNKKVLIIIVIIILVLCIAVGIMFGVKNNENALFVHSYENNAWESTSYGYIIYSDGTIKEYDDFNDNKELKKNKLTKNELDELKELANKVQDKFEVDNSFPMFDAGTIVNKIYNDKLNKWIILDKSGDDNGSKDSEESKKIKELVDKLYEKYIK